MTKLTIEDLKEAVQTLENQPCFTLDELEEAAAQLLAEMKVPGFSFFDKEANEVEETVYKLIPFNQFPHEKKRKKRKPEWLKVNT